MAKFNVVFEIDVDDESPIDAAKQVQEMVRTDDWQWYVQNEDTKEVFSVDLQEEDEDAVLPVSYYEPLIKQ